MNCDCDIRDCVCQPEGDKMNKVGQAVAHFKATNNKKNRNDDLILKAMVSALSESEFRKYMIATEKINTVGSGRELVR